MSAFYQVLLAGKQVAPMVPLRTLYFDDQDYSFFTYAGNWYKANGGWPGGSRNNTVTYRAAVVPSEPTLLVDTPVIRFRGTADEGIDFIGSAEDAGKNLFFIRALDSTTDTGWVPFGPPVGSYCYRYVWNPAVAQDARPENVHNYELTFYGQSNYDHLNFPGIIQLRGLPAGRYQFRIEKPANTTNPGDNGGRALYFDGANVYTCHPTLS